MNRTFLSPKKIIVVKTHALGDVLMTTPALKALKQHFQNAQIDYLTGVWSAEAVRNNQNLDRVIDEPDEIFHQYKFFKLAELMQKIRSERYDLGILFQPSRFARILLRISGVKILAGPYRGSRPGSLTYSVPWRLDRNRYVVEDFLDIVRSLGIAAADSAMEYRIPQSALADVNRRRVTDRLPDGGYMVICPGGAQNPRDFVKQKLWPVDHYYELIKLLESSGIRIIIAGSESDRTYIKRILDLPGIVDWTGKTTFAQLAALLKSARLLLTNDSAPMHLALAVGCPFVAIFGPSRDQALLPPVGNFQVIRADIPCSPCYDNEPFGRCDRDDCIESVSVDKVREAVLKAWSR
ncbi:glycosyltransferase family 9 protein [bacterium]|nr:glycosyltransferase family 9 protein [candidate division CSSED10-310 bacterium]